MIGDIKKKAGVILAALLFLGVFMGAFGVLYHYMTYDEPLSAPKETINEPVKVTQKDQKKTTFQYVPKAKQERTDVEIQTVQQPIVVAVNGRQHEVETTIVKEEHKMENGKLVVTEERQVVLDVKVPEPPRFKKGIYVDHELNHKETTIGARLSYQTKEFDIDLKADVWGTKGADTKIMLTGTKWF